VDRDAIAATVEMWRISTVQIQDATGRMAPTAANEVAFELEGRGEIIGLDNGGHAEPRELPIEPQKGFQRIVPGHSATTGATGPDPSDGCVAGAEIGVAHGTDEG